MSKHFTDRFQDASDVFHRQYRPSEISVDWDAYTKNRDNPDETASVAHIYTERLHLQSFDMSYIDDAHQFLWGDKEVMRLFHTGNTRSKKEVSDTLTRWNSRWGTKNPFSGFAVHTNDDDEFFASVVLGGADISNAAELAYLSAHKMQGKKFGKEYIGSIVFDWSRWIIEHNHQLPSGQNFLNIVATAHVENGASNKILADFGFRIESMEEKYGHMRNHYELPVCVMGDLVKGDES